MSTLYNSLQIGLHFFGFLDL